jgi:hypothetical protein
MFMRVDPHAGHEEKADQLRGFAARSGTSKSPNA